MTITRESLRTAVVLAKFFLLTVFIGYYLAMEAVKQMNGAR